MIKWIKDRQKIFIGFSFAYLYVLMMMVYPTSSQAVTPGPITPVDSIIVIEDCELNKDFYTVAVIAFRPMTPFQAMIVGLDKESTTRELSTRQKDTTVFEDYIRGQISKEVSYKMAVIQAYEMASLIDASIIIDYEYKGLIVDYRPSHLTELRIGDVIVAINGMSYVEYSHEAFLNLAYLDEVTFLVQRTNPDGQQLLAEVSYTYTEVDERMIFYPKYDILNSDPRYEFPGLDSVTGGPSGGLMQTLSIYSSLVNINTHDLKIAGSGTIEYGGLVGPVGSIPQKLYAAKREKVDLFFMPKSLEGRIPDYKFPFDIILVETLEEAIYELHKALN